MNCPYTSQSKGRGGLTRTGLACRPGLSHNRRHADLEHQTHNRGRNLPDRPAPNTGFGRGNWRASYYGPLENLLNAVGKALKPKVSCVGELADQGAGHPDFGLYAAKQLQRNQPREGQVPERGVVEVKSANDDAWLTAASTQVSRYWERYRLVLVTNTRDFVLVGEDTAGHPATLETFRLAESAEAFTRSLETPHTLAHEVGAGLGEYLARALSHRARLTDPKDLAWLLASYARDALARIETADDTPQLTTLRTALEEALGVRFKGDKGTRFFYSTLVQTLFYGVFSAWVLWARQVPSPRGTFNWHEAVWHLRAPVLAALFQQLSSPSQLRPLGLVEVLDWTSARSTAWTAPPSLPASTKARPCPISTNPFSKPLTLSYGNS